MELYVEWTTYVSNRKGRMIKLSHLPNILKLRDPGYSSYYMFDKEAADEIVGSGSSRDFGRFKVFQQYLIIDLDGGQSSLDYVEPCLKKQGLEYEVWESGGKGFHIYIPHQPEFSEDLPYSHKMAVMELIPDADKYADMSLYQHGRLLSLPGRVHPKTRRKKQFVKKIQGNALTLKVVTPPAVFASSFTSMLDTMPLAKGLERIVGMCMKPPSQGNRHTQLWGTAKDLAESGLDYETVLNLLKKVNELWKDQKLPEEVELAVSQAFNRFKRG